MKKILSTICLAGAMILCSCEDTRLDGMSPDTIYIVQDRVQEVFVNRRDYADFTISVYKSGLGETAGKVRLEVDPSVLDAYNSEHGSSMELLDELCYSLSRTSKNFKPQTVSFNCSVTIDGAILAMNSNVGEKNYAIPIRVVSENPDLPVQEDKSTLLIIPVLE